MLKRLFVALGMLLGLFVLFLVTVVANVQFSMPHPRDRSVKMYITEHGAVLLPPGAKGAKPTAGSTLTNRGFPQATVPEAVFQFGRMDPHTSGKHSFEVRNTGDAPLTLEVTGTTCKCTVGGVSANEVPPGEHAFVTLEWNTGYKLRDYAQSADVRTNDPLKPSIRLEVAGKVRLLFGSAEEAVVAPSVAPGKPTSAEVVLYSQIWDDMEILEVKSALPGLTHELSDVSSEEAERIEAKSARRLRLHIPGDLPEGEFSDVVRIKGAPQSAPRDVVEYELTLHGKTLRRLTIFGPFTEDNIINLGQVAQQTGQTLRLTMKVRDANLALPISGLEVQPAFLRVKAEQHREEGVAVPGLYDLLVEVPAGAPAGQFMGNPIGTILVKTEHPRIPEIRLQVRFAVAP